MIDLDLPNSEDYYNLKCNGRILSLGVRLKNICPGRRIALGVIVTEIIAGIEYSRGFKAITVAAQQAPDSGLCTKVIVKPIIFVFPEDVGPTPHICSERLFRVRLIAHYMDTGITDFDICPIIPVPISY